jgi:phage major head subunit gpT-like protein
MYEQLSLLGKIIKAAWSKIFDGSVNTELQDVLSEPIESNNKKEAYSFTYLFGAVREWLGDAIYDTGKTYEYEIKNKDWQRGFQIKQSNIDDMGANPVLNSDYKKKVSSIATNFVSHKNKRHQECLEANGTAFDGTAFFADSRPNISGGTALDNICTRTGVTTALIFADINSAITQMDAMQIDGNPLNEGAKIACIVPTHLYTIFNTIMISENIDLGAGPITNTLRGTFSVVKNYRQATTNNNWYMVNTASIMKALILQNREAPFMKEIKDEDKDLVKYNWKARYEIGYGNPFAIIWVYA